MAASVPASRLTLMADEPMLPPQWSLAVSAMEEAEMTRMV
jgi:hypothetical protein